MSGSTGQPPEDIARLLDAGSHVLAHQLDTPGEVPVDDVAPLDLLGLVARVVRLDVLMRGLSRRGGEKAKVLDRPGVTQLTSEVDVEEVVPGRVRHDAAYGGAVLGRRPIAPKLRAFERALVGIDSVPAPPSRGDMAPTQAWARPQSPVPGPGAAFGPAQCTPV